MAVKQITTEVMSALVSWTGLCHSSNPAGDFPAQPSLLLYTDIIAGPTSGGENDLGCYITVTGTNFGQFADYGTLSHLYIGGVEVANYRYLRTAPGAQDGRMELCAQVGALGSPTPGVALNITMSIRGNALSNQTVGLALADLAGNAITFIPQPGPIVFVSLTGNDANAGTIDAPLRHFQTYDGSTTFGGAVYGPVSGRTTDNQIVPGTHIIGRGGDYGNDTSHDSRLVSGFRWTGLEPTGAAKTGPIVFMPYPGPAGANAPEEVVYTGSASSIGCFNGADTTRSGETTPWGTVGFFKWVTISKFTIIANPLNNTDGAPINGQTGCDHLRVINCDLSWRVASGGPTAAGIAGEGQFCAYHGNYIHHVFDPSGNLQNHGIYIGNNTSVSISGYHEDISFNRIEDIDGGSGMNFRGWCAGAPADSAPWLNIHHNRIARATKHGLVLFDGRARANVWANQIVDVEQSPFFINTDIVTVAGGIYLGHNTCVGWGTFTGGSYPAVFSDGGPNTGSVHVENNVFYCRAGTQAPSFDRFFTSRNGLAFTFSGNCWYDASGYGTKPAGDTTGIELDPLFTNLTTDFAPQAASPLIDSAAANTSVNGTLYAFDAAYLARPQGAATLWSIGALEHAA